MNPSAVQSYLESFINYELKLDQLQQRNFKLQRIENLLEAIGNPQNKLKVIHVAGTKGKGSTCVFTASVLAQAGYRVGLYTSPHLCDLNERIRILSADQFLHGDKNSFSGKISTLQMANILQEIKPALERLRVDPHHGRLSYFEVLTAVAMVYFSRKRVDFAVLETGLGGRLDATNAAQSLVSAITPISLDHTQQLGKTISLIAQEKAAIIKRRNQFVVVGPQPRAAASVIRKRCQEFDARVLWVGKDIRPKMLSRKTTRQTFSIKTFAHFYDQLETRLLGDHQCANAAVCVGIVECLRRAGYEISDQAVRQGIARTFWPGRFEVLRKDPYVILDGAHNPASAKVLARGIRDLFPKKAVSLVLGMSVDKDQKGIARELNRIVKNVVFTRAANLRASVLSANALKKMFPGKKIVLTSSVAEALDLALNSAAREDVVLVTGSLFVVGEARAFWMKRFFRK